MGLDGITYLFYRYRLTVLADAQMPTVDLSGKLLRFHSTIPLSKEVKYGFLDLHLLIFVLSVVARYSVSLSSLRTFGALFPARIRIFFPLRYIWSWRERTTAVSSESSLIASHSRLYSPSGSNIFLWRCEHIFVLSISMHLLVFLACPCKLFTVFPI